MISWTMLAVLASILTTRRSTGSSSTTTVAPSTVPVRLAMPPKITIAKIGQREREAEHTRRRQLQPGREQRAGEARRAPT